VALMDEMLTLNEDYASLFLALQAANPAYPFEPLVRLLSSNSGQKADDLYISSTAAKILALLIIKSPSVSGDLPRAVFNWFNQRLHESTTVDERVFALSAVQVLLRKNEYRVQLAGKDGINQLLSLVRGDEHRQVLYQAVLCLWLLSFNRAVASTQFPRTRAVQAMSKLIGVISTSKVIRITILTLHNLANRGRNNQEMIEAGVLKKVTSMKATPIPDEELQAAVDSLQLTLRVELQKLRWVLSGVSRNWAGSSW
jgi:V-type H+-transporting ATPase subunit H